MSINRCDAPGCTTTGRNLTPVDVSNGRALLLCDSCLTNIADWVVRVPDAHDVKIPQGGDGDE